MRKDLFQENRSRILFTLISVLTLAAFCVCVYGVHAYFGQKNADTVQKALDQLTYTEEKADEELLRLQKMADEPFLSDATRGALYQAMTEISYMAGDDMQYNRFIAYANFYLRQAGDPADVVYLTNKYIGRLYANGYFASAEELLKNLAAQNDLSTLSFDVQVSYLLSCADVAEMQQKDPADWLKKAAALMSRVETAGNRALCQAKLDLLYARDAINKQDFDTAQKILSAYHETDHFGLGADQVYVVCDYLIPYTELSAKLALHTGDSKSTYALTDRYIALCDSYQFRDMKLRLLQYLVANSDAGDEREIAQYKALEKQVIQENLTEITTEYGKFLLNDIHATEEHLQREEERQTQLLTVVQICIVGLFLLLLLQCIALIFIDYLNRDGLTGLRNRKKYERLRTLYERRKTPYSLLLLDIDDFKKVNDSFGHARGDDVLRKIAAILRRFYKEGTAYRYGGEELCLFLPHHTKADALALGNTIRLAIEQEVSTEQMHITVSGGVGVSEKGENVFQQADMQLYHAKSNGKNQIC